MHDMLKWYSGRSEAGRPSQRTVQQRAQQRARTEASRSSSGGMDSGSDSGADVGVTHDASWQTRTAATSAPLPVRTSLSTHHLMCGACSPMDDPVIDLAQVRTSSLRPPSTLVARLCPEKCLLKHSRAVQPACILTGVWSCGGNHHRTYLPLHKLFRCTKCIVFARGCKSSDKLQMNPCSLT